MMTQDTRFGPEADGMQVEFLRATAERGIGPLRCRPECAELVAALDKAFTDPLEMQRRVLTANNDLTDVLCHGDFLRNNLLYKQDVCVFFLVFFKNRLI
jgi:Ser/Thr protein kinase RdoA (MazF antagonist)